MAVIGVASVRIKPDLTLFKHELEAGLKKIDAALTVKVNADLDRADRQLKDFQKKWRAKDFDLNANVKIKTPKSSSIKNTDRDFAKFRSTVLSVGTATVSSTAKIAALALAVGTVASTISGSIGVIGGLGSAIASIGAASVGVGAAGLTALLAGVATVKLGVSGLGDAFKAVGEGDAAKLAEALKKLPPPAREFVTQVAKLKPALDGLKLATQTALLKGLGQQIVLTGNALKGLATETFSGIGSALNRAATDILKFVREAGTLKTIDILSDNIVKGFDNASKAARPLTQAIIDIVSSASNLLPQLGQSFTNLTQKFADFISVKAKSGELTEFFRNAIEQVKQFGRTIRDFGVGISNIFKIGADGGGGFLSLLEQAASKFRSFTESFRGTLIIQQLFGVLQTLSSGLGNFFRALEPVIPVVLKFVSVLADQLAKIMTELGPIIASLAETILGTLAEVLPDLTPVIIAVADAAARFLKAAIPLAKPLVKILEAVTPLLDPLAKLAEAILPPLAKILEPLAPVIEVIAKAIGFLVEVVTKAIEGLVKLMENLKNIGKIKDFILASIGVGDFKDISDPGKGLGKVGQDITKSLGTGIESGTPGLLATINGMVAKIPPQMSTAVPGAGTAGTGVGKAFGTGVSQETGPTLSILDRLTGGMLSKLNGSVPQFTPPGTNSIGGFIQGMNSQLGAAQNAAGGVVLQSLNAVTQKVPQFRPPGQQISETLGAGIQSSNAPENAASGVAGKLPGFFSRVSLFTQGAQIMSSLESGIQSRVGFLQGILNKISGLIPSWKGPESVDRVLLKPAGIAIMDGLIGAIQSKQTELQSTLNDVTGQFESAFAPSANISAEVARSFNLAGDVSQTPVNVDVRVDEGVLAGFIQVKIDDNNRSTRRSVMAGGIR